MARGCGVKNLWVNLNVISFHQQEGGICTVNAMGGGGPVAQREIQEGG